MNFRKTSKKGGRESFLIQKIYMADFEPTYRAFFGGFPKTIETQFSENGGGGQRPFGIFRKLIRFGTLTRPLQDAMCQQTL